jgi:hypothetical protein
MGIENWPDTPSDPVEVERPAPAGAVDEPRRHMLGSFRPGLGFAPSEIDTDETLTGPIDLDLDSDEPPFAESDETLDAHVGHR